MTFGRTMRMLRERSELTQREAAKRLGISNVHLCRLESDLNRPSLDLLDRMGKLYGDNVYTLAQTEWVKS